MPQVHFQIKMQGQQSPVTTTGFATGGADAFNYNLSQPLLSAGILPRTLTVTANDLYKPYKSILTFTGSEYRYTGLLPGDILPSFSLSSAGAEQSSPPGEYAIIISGGSLANYSIVYVNGTLSVGKNTLTARADNKIKIYGSENPVLTITYSGFIKWRWSFGH